MKKKLTLNKTWTEELRQYKWVSGQRGDVNDLKTDWMDANGYGEEIQGACFFCQYDKEYDNDCDHCPGRLVDKQFLCTREEYYYIDYRKKFYRELLRLYGIRKKKLLQRRKSK